MTKPEPPDASHPWPVFFLGLFCLGLALLGLLTREGDGTSTGGFPVQLLDVGLLVFVAYLWWKVARVLLRRRK
jgi:hypothetical protein